MSSYAYQKIRLGGYTESVLLAFSTAAERRAFHARHPLEFVTRKRVPRAHLQALRFVGTCGCGDAIGYAIVATSLDGGAV